MNYQLSNVGIANVMQCGLSGSLQPQMHLNTNEAEAFYCELKNLEKNKLSNYLSRVETSQQSRDFSNKNTYLGSAEARSMHNVSYVHPTQLNQPIVPNQNTYTACMYEPSNMFSPYGNVSAVQFSCTSQQHQLQESYLNADVLRHPTPPYNDCGHSNIPPVHCQAPVSNVQCNLSLPGYLTPSPSPNGNFTTNSPFGHSASNPVAMDLQTPVLNQTTASTIGWSNSNITVGAFQSLNTRSQNSFASPTTIASQPNRTFLPQEQQLNNNRPTVFNPENHSGCPSLPTQQCQVRSELPAVNDVSSCTFQHRAVMQKQSYHVTPKPSEVGRHLLPAHILPSCSSTTKVCKKVYKRSANQMQSILYFRDVFSIPLKKHLSKSKFKSVSSSGPAPNKAGRQTLTVESTANSYLCPERLCKKQQKSSQRQVQSKKRQPKRNNQMPISKKNSCNNHQASTIQKQNAKFLNKLKDLQESDKKSSVEENDADAPNHLLTSKTKNSTIETNNDFDLKIIDCFSLNTSKKKIKPTSDVDINTTCGKPQCELSIPTSCDLTSMQNQKELINANKKEEHCNSFVNWSKVKNSEILGEIDSQSIAIVESTKMIVKKEPVESNDINSATTTTTPCSVSKPIDSNVSVNQNEIKQEATDNDCWPSELQSRSTESPSLSRTEISLCEQSQTSADLVANISTNDSQKSLYCPLSKLKKRTARMSLPKPSKSLRLDRLYNTNSSNLKNTQFVKDGITQENSTPLRDKEQNLFNIKKSTVKNFKPTSNMLKPCYVLLTDLKLSLF